MSSFVLPTAKFFCAEKICSPLNPPTPSGCCCAKGIPKLPMLLLLVPNKPPGKPIGSAIGLPIPSGPKILIDADWLGTLACFSLSLLLTSADLFAAELNTWPMGLLDPTAAFLRQDHLLLLMLLLRLVPESCLAVAGPPTLVSLPT